MMEPWGLAWLRLENWGYRSENCSKMGSQLAADMARTLGRSAIVRSTCSALNSTLWTLSPSSWAMLNADSAAACSSALYWFATDTPITMVAGMTAAAVRPYSKPCTDHGVC